MNEASDPEAFATATPAGEDAKQTTTAGAIVVIGAGQAGQSLAETLRKHGYSGRIVLIGEEPVRPYQRPPLSKKYLLGEMEEDRLYFRPEAYYDEHRIELRLGARVDSVDLTARTVTLAGGETIAFDKLAFTTGSRPRMLPAAIGGDLKGVYAVRSLADIDAMGPHCTAGKSVLIVGGGYIGLEAASVTAKLGLKTTVVEMAPRILARVASEATSDYFMRLHGAHGVDIKTGVGLDRLEGDGAVSRAVLTDGTAMDVDLVVVGIGIQPNSEIAEAAGVPVENGIAVDQTGRTLSQDVYAAGDCASFPWQGTRIRLESVQNAIDQAEIAAKAMLGQEARYEPVPWFWSDQYDVKLQIVGLSQGHDQTVVRPGKDEWSQSIWYFRDGDLISVDAMNDPRAYMVGKRLLEMGRTPEQTAVQDPDLDLKSLLK